jgi:allophanate hydrolase subunit 2
MGMRLDGPPLEHVKGYNIISDGIAPGSIQVPGNGQPLLLLADRQTTGGYPKIATVISADLAALGRVPVGAKIGFEPVTLEMAQRARRDLEAEADRIEIRPLRPREIDSRLFDCNLISGVVDGTHSPMPTPQELVS